MIRKHPKKIRFYLAILGLLVSMMSLSCRSNQTDSGVLPVRIKVTQLTANVTTPSAITMDRRGNLYVVDREKGCVDVIMPDGTKTVLAEGLATPTGIAVDFKGRAYVCEASLGTIQCIHPSGEITRVAEGLCQPAGITLDRDGDLIVACKGNGSIVKIEGGQRIEPKSVTIQIL